MISRIENSLFWRFAIGIGLSVLSAILIVLAFPPYTVWPLVFIGWVPMLIAQYRLLPAKWSALAPALAIGLWLQGYLGPVFRPIGTFMVWLPLIVAGLTLLTDRGLQAFHQKTAYRWFVPMGVLNWAGTEMIRLFIPIAGTWAFIAYPLYRQTWLIQPVSLFGIIGMGMVVMWINYGLALGCLRWLETKTTPSAEESRLSPRLVKQWLIATAGMAAVWLGLSLALYLQPLSTPSLQVAAIQPSRSLIMSALAGEEGVVTRLHQRMLEQSREAANQGARIIVWPEGVMPWDPLVEDRLGLRSLTAETNAYLASGYVIVTEQGLRNEATVLSPSGEFLGVFGKDHPVVFAGETSLTRGTYPVYSTELGRVATIICYDLDYTDTARKMAAQGAQLIAVPSNDWSTIADKHYTHLVFRAVENRVAMVKADGGWDSAIIDPYGHIKALAAFPQGGEATLVGEVQIGHGKGSLYTRLGDWTGWLGLIGMIFFAVAGGWLEKRSESSLPKGFLSTR
ncbi:MAG: hypothetical protein DDG59_07145 [Anaerolineae bacterium]|nr:MAG: hypothetical protein DDG59_07145 [Anaerolineae bacterium]